MSDGRNRRLLDRCAIDARIEVVDQMSGEKIGDLVNIHVEGLMLASDVNIDADSVYQVEVRPTGNAEEIGSFELGIESLWVRSMAKEEGCWVGCRIISGSQEAVGKIQKIINLFDG